LGKPLKAAVIGPFHRVRETTGRKLAHAKVVLQALAANALSRTPAVAAIAPFQIGWLLHSMAGLSSLKLDASDTALKLDSAIHVNEQP